MSSVPVAIGWLLRMLKHGVPQLRLGRWVAKSPAAVFSNASRGQAAAPGGGGRGSGHEPSMRLCVLGAAGPTHEEDTLLCCGSSCGPRFPAGGSTGGVDQRPAARRVGSPGRQVGKGCGLWHPSWDLMHAWPPPSPVCVRPRRAWRALCHGSPELEQTAQALRKPCAHAMRAMQARPVRRQRTPRVEVPDAAGAGGMVCCAG